MWLGVAEEGIGEVRAEEVGLEGVDVPLEPALLLDVQVVLVRLDDVDPDVAQARQAAGRLEVVERVVERIHREDVAARDRRNGRRVGGHLRDVDPVLVDLDRLHQDVDPVVVGLGDGATVVVDVDLAEARTHGRQAGRLGQLEHQRVVDHRAVVAARRVEDPIGLGAEAEQVRVEVLAGVVPELELELLLGEALGARSSDADAAVARVVGRVGHLGRAEDAVDHRDRSRRQDRLVRRNRGAEAVDDDQRKRRADARYGAGDLGVARLGDAAQARAVDDACPHPGGGADRNRIGVGRRGHVRLAVVGRVPDGPAAREISAQDDRQGPVEELRRLREADQRQGLRGVERPGSGRREVAGGVDVVGQSVGLVGDQAGELGRVLEPDRGPVGLDQREVLAAGAQLEVRVQLRTGDGAVLVRAEHQQVRVVGDDLGGERPLGEVRGIVCQVPAVQVDRRARGVLELDPVAELAVFVRQRGGVAGDELVDVQPALAGQDAVGLTGGGQGEEEQARRPVEQTALGNVLHLRAVVHDVDGDQVRVEQRDLPEVLLELERQVVAGVELLVVGDERVGLPGADVAELADAILLREQVGVRDVQTRQEDRIGQRVVDLDEVLEVAGVGQPLRDRHLAQVAEGQRRGVGQPRRRGRQVPGRIAGLPRDAQVRRLGAEANAVDDEAGRAEEVEVLAVLVEGEGDQVLQVDDHDPARLDVGTVAEDEFVGDVDVVGDAVTLEADGQRAAVDQLDVVRERPADVVDSGVVGQHLADTHRRARDHQPGAGRDDARLHAPGEVVAAQVERVGTAGEVVQRQCVGAGLGLTAGVGPVVD